MPRYMALCLVLMSLCEGGRAVAVQGSPPAVLAPVTPAERIALTRGRALVKDFYAVRMESVWQAFVPGLREEWGSLTSFRAFRTAGVITYGAEKQVVRERVFSDQGITYYVRTASFERDPQNLWNIVVGFDGVGRIIVFAITAQENNEDDRFA